VITQAETKVKECEGAAVPLMCKLTTLKSTEMGPLADEVTASIDGTKELIDKAKKMIEAISEDLEAELKQFVTIENMKLNPKLTSYSQKLQKCESIVTKFRAEVSKKELQELEGFRLNAVKAIRAYQNKISKTDYVDKDMKQTYYYKNQTQQHLVEAKQPELTHTSTQPLHSVRRQHSSRSQPRRS